MYRGQIRPGVVAALIEHLPSACALGRDLGGAAAMSDEWKAIAALDLDVRTIAWVMGGKKGDKPDPWEPPIGRREQEARVAREAEAKRRWRERVATREQREQAGERMTLRDL